MRPAKGVRLCSGFLGSPPCVRRLQVAKRACVLGRISWSEVVRLGGPLVMPDRLCAPKSYG
jgi:hypothetical protein